MNTAHKETLPKNFDYQAAEQRWTRHWEEKGYYQSKPDGRKPFTVVIPPPNVTGVLHMGHTLNETVQDVLVRHARMNGYNACWVPGSDHASIATEAKVVQMLEKEKGIKKANLSRQDFLKHAFEWKEKYGGIIYSQIKALGCSVDWKRVTFTMDDHYYTAVIKVFVDLYSKGLIYRGARMINWDPAAKTALSDEEVEYKDVQGKLYYVKYLVADDGATNEQQATKNFITIATQRPETIMGDVAICVHPDDERYKPLHNKSVFVPLINRRIPVFCDEYVDPAFGTGALKITPAHDINDYNLGIKHNLTAIDTLNEDGTLSEAAQIFVGMDRFEARKQIVQRLGKEGLLQKEEEYSTRVGLSQRTGVVVEPRISTQWFVKMRSLAQDALDAVVGGNIKIHPEERFLATYKYWLENVKDWCISRQLWWGQRIPAWYDEAGNLYVAETEMEARQKAAERILKSDENPYNDNDADSIINTIKLSQDDDVLDTWFSSWLWPIEVFNGISNPGNEEIKYYYPTQVLVTGQDIIFFWVARMIMAGMQYQNERPFEHVYFTGMVRDKQGRKMSKSLGNSPDLLELIERFGADAVRFGILIAAPAGNDLLFDESSCEQGRNFNNKLWNALKLVQLWEAAGTKASDEADEQDLSQNFAALWFNTRLETVSAEVEKLYSEFKLSEALKTVYSLIWDDFCSWYLEWVKPPYGEKISLHLLAATINFYERLLQLLHPFMPFVTEELYHHLADRKAGDDLTISQLNSIQPLPFTQATPDLLVMGDRLKTIVTALREVRSSFGLKPKETIGITIQTDKPESFALITALLQKSVNADALTFGATAPANATTVVIGKDKFFVTAASSTTADAGAQRESLEKELAYHRGFLQSVEKKLSNERFVQNAKPEVVELERKKKTDAEEKIKLIEETLGALSA